MDHFGLHIPWCLTVIDEEPMREWPINVIGLRPVTPPGFIQVCGFHTLPFTRLQKMAAVCVYMCESVCMGGSVWGVWFVLKKTTAT